MSDEWWSKVNELFHQAAALPTDERDAFLIAACGNDAELLAEVRSLLRHHDRPLEFLDEPSIAGRVALDPQQLVDEAEGAADPLLGRTIGPYLLERRIAAGGMGAVYVGAREDDFLKHTVAVKILHRTPDTENLRRRFRIERQTLANLSHPNIARFQDAGVTPDGLPYIIMELIDGVPIDEYCDTHRLSVRQRLQLFLQICAAVHVAHQNLIVHRDLKPGNVLVTHDGTPKLLDFGIAKVLDPHSTDQPLTTPQTVTRMLSIDYASPEQIRGESVTTATDIYSLGVILYELLVGTRPYCMTSSHYEHVKRAICDDEPKRPSTAVRSPTQTSSSHRRADALAGRSPALTAHQRGTTVERLSRDLRGDLDNIIMMAMRKEPHRRYGSSQQFAEDIQRYLDDHPVVARKDTLVYRTRKFIHRNRLAVSAAAVVVLALIAATTITTRQANIITAERDAARAAEQVAAAEAQHARIEADSATQVAEFLADAVLAFGPARTPEELADARDLLERQATRVRRQYVDQPHLRANLFDAIGRVHMHLDDDDNARALMNEAHEIRRAHFGEQSLEHALSLNSLGELDFRQARYGEAAEKFRTALRLHETLPHGVHTNVALACNNLAVVLRALRQVDEAEALHLRALEMRRQEHGDRSPLVAESLNNLAGINFMRGEFEQAERRLREALEIGRDVLGESHPLIAQYLSNLAAAHFQQGEFDVAEPLLREAIDLYHTTPAATAEGYARALRNLAAIERRRGNADAARKVLNDAHDELRGLYGPSHPHIANVLVSIATLDEMQGDSAAAFDRWREAVRMYAETLPPDHPAQADALTGYGVALVSSGQHEDAVRPLERALAMFESAYAPNHTYAVRAKINLGSCLIALARYEEAEPLLLEAHEQLRSRQDDASQEAAAARHLIELFEATGREARARELSEQLTQ